jgi:hypothetical protein
LYDFQGHSILARGFRSAPVVMPTSDRQLNVKAALYAQRPAMKIAVLVAESMWITD